MVRVHPATLMTPNQDDKDSTDEQVPTFNADEIDGEIVVAFEDRRVDYSKHEDYRVRDE